MEPYEVFKAHVEAVLKMKIGPSERRFLESVYGFMLKAGFATIRQQVRVESYIFPKYLPAGSLEPEAVGSKSGFCTYAEEGTK